MSEEMRAEKPSSRSAGGKARAKKMTPEELSSSAQRAAEARWGPAKEAVCGSPDKPLRIGDIDIECYVLEDGTRVITQASFLRALGRNQRSRQSYAEGGLPPFVQAQSLEPYLPAGLVERGKPIRFEMPTDRGGTRALGYNAELLPDVCEAFLAARAAGALSPNQRHIADQAEILVRGLSRIGIIALVDEATGYQDVRTKNALEKILEEFIDKELQVYLKTFPDDFYKEMFRLRGMDYSADSVQRPQYFGILTNNVVYKRLAPGVLDELKKVQEKNADGRPKHKLFQRLSQNVGYPKLREHLGSVTMLMKLSENWDDFEAKLDEYYPKINTDIALPGMPRQMRKKRDT